MTSGHGPIAEPVVAPEPTDDPDGAALGETTYAAWCPDVDCRSNHAIPRLTCVRVRRSLCSACRAELTGPISLVLAHRRTH